MPRIKRWFPVSHDINHSPTMRELAHQFGLAGWRIWFEILSIADRAGEDIDCTSEGALSRLTSAAETRLKVTRKVIEALLKGKCIATIDQHNHVTRVLNYWEYHRSEERKPRPPDLPDPTEPNRIKKKSIKSTYPDGFVVSESVKEWAAAEMILHPESYLQAFKDHHVSKGNRFTDWDAAFRNWLRNSKRFGGNGNGNRHDSEPKGFASVREFMARGKP